MVEELVVAVVRQARIVGTAAHTAYQHHKDPYERGTRKCGHDALCDAVCNERAMRH